MDFIPEGNVLPVPLNLIPPPRSIYMFFKNTLCTSCCSDEDDDIESSDIELTVTKPGAVNNVYDDMVCQQRLSDFPVC